MKFWIKKILRIVVLGMLISGNAYADPKNPTNQWLETQSINSLTQKHGYKLLHTATYANQIVWTLTKSKNFPREYSFIVVTCVSKGKVSECWLP